MKNAKVKEIENKFTAFQDEAYNNNDEILDQELLLENEMASITFGKEQAEGKRIFDVLNHYSDRNRSENKGLDELVDNFRKDCYELNNSIRGNISGRKGETLTFKKLNYLLSEHSIRKNIEIGDGIKKTEIDALVITKKAAFIIEVKNTKRDIYIDEFGQYYRTGEFLKWDSDLGAKLAMREAYVRKAAEKSGITNINVLKIVVFTDNHITVQNKCDDFRTCFLNQLTSIIDNYCGENIMALSEIDKLTSEIDAMTSVTRYKPNIDVQKIKSDFAELVYAMDYQEEEIETKTVWWKDLISAFASKRVAAASFALGIEAAVVTAILQSRR